MTELPYGDIIQDENNFSDADLRGARALARQKLNDNARIARFLTEAQLQELEQAIACIHDINVEIQRRKKARRANNN
jgi:hypothetical protein